MVDETPKSSESRFIKCGEIMKGMQAGPGDTECPMAAMMKDTADKPGAGFLLMIPGAILIVLGVLIVVEPRILVWLMAGLSILLGIVMLVIANFIRRLSAQFRIVHE